MLDDDLLSGSCDEELAELCRKGVDSAFGVIASRYYLLLRKKAMELADIGDDCEDLFQEGLIALYDAAMTYEKSGGASFRTYAGVCVRNRMISAVRHQQALKNRSVRASSSIEEASEVPSAPEADPLNAVIMREELEAFEKYLRDVLSDSERAVLELYLEGLSYEDISVRLGITKKSCGNAMQRVRQKLKKHIRFG